MTTFETTGLYPEILDAINDLGFKTPTPIQQKTIPFLLENKQDLIALAQTGTGKTAAFGLPLIQLTDVKQRGVQSLILCPTRELCLQIAQDLDAFSKYLPKVSIAAIYGGANINTQVKQLRQGANIVVGTPGRTLDLIRRGDLKIGDLRILVLDEADEMLDRGFKHDLDAILSAAPVNRKTWLFSATMPDEIARISRQYLQSPEKISAGKLNAGAEKVSHEYYFFPTKGRYSFLRDLLRAYQDVYGIVFCRTKRKAKEVARRLHRDGFKAEALQGNMSQSQRDTAMAKFKSGKARILVATDVAARGVDIDNLSHVINFNLPDVDEVYIHRSGRTGRAQRSGISISILEREESGRIKGLEKLARKPFSQKTLADITNAPAEAPSFDLPPTPEAFVEKMEQEQPYHFIFSKLDKVMESDSPADDLKAQLPMFRDYLGNVSREELIDRLVTFFATKKAKDKPQPKPHNHQGQRRKRRYKARRN